MELVLADDFTGAAEMAGIAWRAGRSVDFCTALPEELQAEVTVVDTDTRLLSEEEARQIVEKLCEEIRVRGVGCVFKKIDSVLRGPVAAEIEGALSGLGRRKAIVVSANPSKGRVIRDGQYFIEGVPLHETEFAKDPFHPATTSLVADRLRSQAPIESPDATTVEEVEVIAEGVTSDDLPVGGADFYTAWSKAATVRSGRVSASGRQLWLCGSQAIRNQRNEAFERGGIPVVELVSQAPRDWAEEVRDAFQGSNQVAMEIAPETTKSADELLESLSESGAEVIQRARPDVVFVEGGATSAALANRFGWTRFRVTRELAPGVVGLQPVSAEGVPEVVVKPGSYPWPSAIFEREVAQ